MRDAIFRGISQKGKWIEGDLVRWADAYYISKVTKLVSISNDGYEYVFGGFEMVLPETVGQYTGLCDKNGTKIFEGDITENNDDLYTVEWSEDDASFVLNGDGVQASFDNFWEYELEVIGNIYENKDILDR